MHPAKVVQATKNLASAFSSLPQSFSVVRSPGQQLYRGHHLCRNLIGHVGVASLFSDRCRPILASSTADLNLSEDKEDALPQESLDDNSEVDVDDLLELGTFGAPHGVKGNIKFYAVTDAPAERLSSPGMRYVRPKRGGWSFRSAAPRSVEVENARAILNKGKEVWLLKIKGIDTPEAADNLKGQVLAMPAQERPQLNSDDEFYAQELIGMQVVLQETDEMLGTVVDLYDGTGTYDVLRVELAASSSHADEGSRSVLVPFAAAIVPEVDREARVMRVTLPAGLLDLVTTKNAKAKSKTARKQRVPKAKQEADATKT